MELIYIWIEKFRNIENASLNFSNDHEIQFRKDENKLIIKEIPFGIENFFGNNISNITGIIGRNATGKSNILDIICFLTKGGPSYIDERYLMIYANKKENVEYECYSNFLFEDNNICNVKEIKFNKGIAPNWSVIFLSNVNDGKKHLFPKEVIDLSQNRRRYFGERNRKSDVFYQLKFILSDYFGNVKLDIPKKVTLIPRFEFPRSGNSRQQRVLEGFTRKIKKEIKYYDAADHLRCTYLLSLINFLAYDLYQKTYHLKRENIKLSPNFDEFEKEFTYKFNSTNEFEGVESIVQLSYFISDYFHNYEYEGRTSSSSLSLLLSFINRIDELNPTITQEIGNKRNTRFIYEIELNEANRYILKSYFSEFDIDEIFDVDWGGISSGHKAFINLFAQFHSAIRRVSHHENVLICIDEGDLYLHPQWQKEFLYRIIKFVPTIIKRNLQLVLTTHSPFLVSDLPKENLILLDRDDDGNSVIVPKEESLSKTFGANLNDLLVDSFFLREGIISDFALSKIKQAITIAKDKDSTNPEIAYARKVSSLIGEDLISSKLDKMLSNVKNNN